MGRNTVAVLAACLALCTLAAGCSGKASVGVAQFRADVEPVERDIGHVQVDAKDGLISWMLTPEHTGVVVSVNGFDVDAKLDVVELGKELWRLGARLIGLIGTVATPPDG